MTGNTMFYYRKQTLTSHFCLVTYQPCPVAIRFGFVTARQRCKYFLWLALPEKFEVLTLWMNSVRRGALEVWTL